MIFYKGEIRNDTDRLVDMLIKRGDKKSIKLVKAMYKRYNIDTVIPKWKRIDLKEHRLAKEYLYSLFDDKTRREMIVLDSIISESDRKIPWNFSYFRDSYIHRENFINWDDPEFHECDTFVIVRGKNGFKPLHDESCDHGHGISIYDGEKRLIRRYKKEFEDLYFAITKQEELLHNGGLKSEDDRKLVKLLAYDLGLLRNWIEEKDSDKKLIK